MGALCRTIDWLLDVDASGPTEGATFAGIDLAHDEYFAELLQVRFSSAVGAGCIFGLTDGTSMASGFARQRGFASSDKAAVKRAVFLLRRITDVVGTASSTYALHLRASGEAR